MFLTGALLYIFFRDSLIANLFDSNDSIEQSKSIQEESVRVISTPI